MDERYQGLPIHKVCYHHSSSKSTTKTMTTVENDLDEAMMHCSLDATNAVLVDVFGLTPFHVLATSSWSSVATRTRTTTTTTTTATIERQSMIEILKRLLEEYKVEILMVKDDFGNTMMDYLIRNTSSGTFAAIQMVLFKTIVETISSLGVEKWIVEISRRVKYQTRMELDTNDNNIDNDLDDRERKQACLNETLSYFGYCMRIEMTLILELAKWTSRMHNSSRSRSITSSMEETVPVAKNTDRMMCLLQCGSDLVLDNVTKYLWSDDEESSKMDIALSVFPLCSSEDLVIDKHNNDSNDDMEL